MACPSKATWHYGRMRLAHGWELAGAELALAREFIRPAVRAVPPGMARRLGPCRIVLMPRLEDPDAASIWSESANGLEIALAAEGMPPHDIAIELLTCLGQALWERLEEAEERAWWKLIDREIRVGTGGEIDEQALAEKRALLAGPTAARNRRKLARYGRAAFAAAAVEYVHSLWHDVSVRTGPDFLPPDALRARLELLARWFPPGRGYRLFPGARA